ncbi:MAG: alpha/beta fold hydrolase [Bdellovibrionales bacterium]
MKKFGLPPYYQTDHAVSALSESETFKRNTIVIDDENFSFVTSGDKPGSDAQKQVIVFVHGSPGQWDAWADYLSDDDLLEHFFMIAVDRLGFGGSDNGIHEESLERHARFIMSAVKASLPERRDIIVIGHSYGGPVALQMAIDYPDRVGGLALLAPSIAPDLEVPRWYNHLAALSIVKHLLPSSVRHSNEEILPLKRELNAMQDRLSTIEIPVIVLQGTADKLVPYKNAEFAKTTLINADVTVQLIEDRGHFIPWQDFELVKKTLFKLSNRH